MALNVRWAKRALRRLDEIAAYIAKDHLRRATSFVVELRDKVELLRSHQMGVAGRVFGTKELVLHKNYIVAYRVKGNEVQVITILHAGQNR